MGEKKDVLVIQWTMHYTSLKETKERDCNEDLQHRAGEENC